MALMLIRSVPALRVSQDHPLPDIPALNASTAKPSKETHVKSEKESTGTAPKHGFDMDFENCAELRKIARELRKIAVRTFHGVWLYMVPQVTVRTALQLLRVQVSDARAKTTWIGPGRDGDWNAHSDHDCWFCSASFHKLAMISHEHVFTIQARN